MRETKLFVHESLLYMHSVYLYIHKYMYVFALICISIYIFRCSDRHLSVSLVNLLPGSIFLFYTSTPPHIIPKCPPLFSPSRVNSETL